MINMSENTFKVPHYAISNIAFHAMFNVAVCECKQSAKL